MSDIAPLPARPSLEQLRKQAKDLLKQYQAGALNLRLSALAKRLAAPRASPMRSTSSPASMVSKTGPSLKSKSRSCGCPVPYS